ncbi:YceD family protein [Methylophilus aquaticus]|uniref:Large ribosomal RNA subunit accumulation protein YceD n=1 Tax=Methylophilus aquaticus TaxID=1971610 RepID=A0ABT9JR82_9PROT|nr:YceD family protein [Methylophilus aquaticus]MDP8567082.1 YceD family protein [Methylophilus aquaticus]
MTSAHYLELARQQKTVSGELALATLPRLVDALRERGVTASDALSVTMVRYHLQGLPPGYFGDVQLPMLALTIETELPLVCQRCFQAMPETVALKYAFAVCHEPPEALLEDEHVDWLEPDPEASIEMLVEDELLMALPIAVMHEEMCVALQQVAGEKPNPFAALKSLKLDK